MDAWSVYTRSRVVTVQNQKKKLVQPGYKSIGNIAEKVSVHLRRSKQLEHTENKKANQNTVSSPWSSLQVRHGDQSWYPPNSWVASLAMGSWMGHCPLQIWNGKLEVKELVETECDSHTHTNKSDTNKRKHTKTQTHKNTKPRTGKHKHTTTQTHKHTETQQHRNTKTQTEKHKQTHTHTQTQKHKHANTNKQN